MLVSPSGSSACVTSSRNGGGTFAQTASFVATLVNAQTGATIQGWGGSMQGQGVCISTLFGGGYMNALSSTGQNGQAIPSGSNIQFPAQIANAEALKAVADVVYGAYQDPPSSKPIDTGIPYQQCTCTTGDCCNTYAKSQCTQTCAPPPHSCTPPVNCGSANGGDLVTHVGGDQYCSPILVNLDGRGYQLTNNANGVLFDVFGDHDPLQIAWPTADSVMPGWPYPTAGAR